jgi:hypothetical protein
MSITARVTIVINMHMGNMAITTIVTIIQAANKYTHMARIIHCMSSILSTIDTIWVAKRRFAIQCGCS